jgi:serine/threonine-protein kinase
MFWLLFILKRLNIEETVERKAFIRAANSMALLNHPAIVKLNGIAVSQRNMNEVYLEVPYFEKGDLRNLMETRWGEFSEKQKWNLVFHIAQGLKVLHERNIIHRDLKPENILIDLNDRPVLIDFDLSVQVEVLITSLTSGVSRIVGTAKYIDPLVLESKDPLMFSTKSDMYALGIIIGELLVDPKFEVHETAKVSQI